MGLNLAVDRPTVAPNHWAPIMNHDLDRLLDLARRVEMTPSQLEQQRQSFAYGNTKIENDRITRETVAAAAREIGQDHPERPAFRG